MASYKSIDDVPMELRPYTVVYKKKPRSILNRRLIIEKKVTEEQLERILSLHVEKLKLFDSMTKLDPEKNISLLMEKAKIFEGIEFSLQENWNFDKNSDFHEWYSVPHCGCPKLDNHDLHGTELRVISGSCLIHGVT
jgi:hypothetical protein